MLQIVAFPKPRLTMGFKQRNLKLLASQICWSKRDKVRPNRNLEELKSNLQYHILKIKGKKQSHGLHLPISLVTFTTLFANDVSLGQVNGFFKGILMTNGNMTQPLSCGSTDSQDVAKLFYGAAQWFDILVTGNSHPY